MLNANCLPATDGRVDEITVTVNTTNGQVRGHRAYTIFDQKLFYSFKGIPYGQPPLGNLRFKVSYYNQHCTFYDNGILNLKISL